MRMSTAVDEFDRGSDRELSRLSQTTTSAIRSQSEGPTLPHAWLGTHNIRLLVVTLEAPCWTTPLLVQEFSTTPNDSFLLLLHDNCVSHPPTPLQNLVFAIAGVWAPIDAALRVVWARGRIGARGMPQSWRLHGDGEGNRDGADKMERVQEGDVRGWREWALAMECRPTKCAQPGHGRKFPKWQGKGGTGYAEGQTSGHGVRAPSGTLKDGQLLVWRVEHGTQSGTHYDSSIKYNEPKRVVIESFPACLRPPRAHRAGHFSGFSELRDAAYCAKEHGARACKYVSSFVMKSSTIVRWRMRRKGDPLHVHCAHRPCFLPHVADEQTVYRAQYKHISPKATRVEFPIWCVLDGFGYLPPATVHPGVVQTRADLEKLPITGTAIPVGASAVGAPLSVGTYTNEK
ncbi:hypothetical protein GGX14DRAFT_588473 [Mycena pura]|uniref:Uncharacterized protein n=1 Tax=Mycena pura TaxID=153505 RepID=A0AAD6USC9_9AGAR|nr:hypothetical protein GGX14DRAFT_588473 [Mycena pura]